MRICWHSIYSPKLLYLVCTLKFVCCIYKLQVTVAWLLRGKFVNLGLISSFRVSLCLIISVVNECLIFNSPAIERIHSRGQHVCNFMGTKEIFLHKKRVQLPQDLFGTPIWPPWRHVNTLYTNCWYRSSYWPTTYLCKTFCLLRKWLQFSSFKSNVH